MKLRVNTLWRVPVFSLLAGIVCYYLTVYLSIFYAVKTVGEDGTINLSVDPVRSAIFQGVLFAAGLVVGGLFLFRSMTKTEIAVSAAIAVALEAALSGLLYAASQFAPTLVTWLLPLTQWTGALGSVLTRITQVPAVSWIGLLAPFLFVPFGRGSAR